MRITAEPRSDQWNADDFIGGPRTFTIAGVHPGKATQKYDIELVEGGGRAWRPPLTVLRILLKAWGDEASVWVGRRVTLVLDPDVTYGKDKVGGIRVSHLSHIDKPIDLTLTASRNKKGRHVVQPLRSIAEQIAGMTDLKALKDLWAQADEVTRPLIEARAAELKAVSDAGV